MLIKPDLYTRPEYYELDDLCGVADCVDKSPAINCENCSLNAGNEQYFKTHNIEAYYIKFVKDKL